MTHFDEHLDSDRSDAVKITTTFTSSPSPSTMHNSFCVVRATAGISALFKKKKPPKAIDWQQDLKTPGNLKDTKTKPQ